MFPEVPVIGCAPLAAELTGEAAAPVLIDARETWDVGADEQTSDE